MQLDHTHIAIRERGILDVFDLALHVLRAYARPLLITFLFGAVPLAIFNHFLISWMSDIEWEIDILPARYLWHMTILVFIEAPLASVFATLYLGQVVFYEPATYRRTAYEVFKLSPRLAISHLLIRGVGIVWLLLYLVYGSQEVNVWFEFVVMIPLVLFVLAVRVFRPFINEIILLEKNPLWSSRPDAMTIWRRSGMLHNPSMGDLFAHGIVCVLVACLLTLAIYHALLFIHGVLLNNWRQGPFMFIYIAPLAMWITAFYFMVFRYLYYLDTRIRHEGWEVELTLRAEAARLANKFKGGLA